MIVVVIEDSRTQAAQLRAILAREGLDVRVAEDGEAGLAVCQQLAEPPAVVLSDVLMPGIDGFEVCRRLKADARLAAVPVMLLTSLGDPRDVLRALQAGADNYCTKPYRADVLVRRVRQLSERGDRGDKAEVELDGERFVLGSSIGRLADVLVSSLVDAGERYHALERSRRELEETNAQREELMRIVAHELRSPLQSMLLAADIFDEEDDRAVRSSMAQRTSRQVERMLRIIDDLSDVSSIDLGTLQIVPETTDLVPLVRDTAARVQGTASSHRVEVTSDPSLEVRVDPHRIEQVVTNLLTNAIKYSPEADRVLVKVVRAGDAARVEVTDFGVGLDATEARRVFERYFRADGSKGSIKGVGLGLFISRALIQEHGGRIGVDSAPGRGSSFWFTLPLADAGAAAS